MADDDERGGRVRTSQTAPQFPQVPVMAVCGAEWICARDKSSQTALLLPRPTKPTTPGLHLG
jgi:hypothetical protein